MFLTWTAAALLTAGWVAPRDLDAQERVSFGTQDGGTLDADVYGRASRAVVLAHGGRFDKESWRDQALALERAGFRVLTFDFRGYGRSTGPGQNDPLSAPLHLDVLAAVRYLRATGAESVSVVGGSLGGTAAADAAAEAGSGGIDRLIVLGAGGGRAPEKLTLPKLFIVTRDDASGSGPRLPRIRADFERMPEPKRLVVLEGSAHAQQMFQTEDAERVMDEILAFLSAAPAGFDRVLVSPDGNAVGLAGLYPKCRTSP